jgi:tripartite-type tricarboxylate transporter receptor subunit TctC
MRVLAYCIAWACLMLAGAAHAQTLPFEGPVRLICPYPPGGSSDTLARLVAEKMQGSLGRPVIVENKTGAGGRIAAEHMKTVPKDGSHILIANIVMMVLNPIVEKVGYDPVADFAPISLAGDYQIPLATGKLTGAKDFAELAAWFKANPGKANYGVPAPGSLPHLYGLQIARAAGVPMVMVPFRGGAPIAAALIGGELPAGLAAAADFAAQHRGGALRIVAFSGTKRMPALPDVPTFGELGLKGFDENGWNGFFAPAGAPPAVVARYNEAVVAALKDPVVISKLETLGFQITSSTPEELGRQLVEERKKWQPLLQEAGVIKQ